MTLLSICIPTYNRAEMLAYCLTNLRVLDGLIDYEIVVVDHASTDHTPQVLADACARWPNLRHYRQTHQVGIERQFGGCLRMGRGQFTVYVADDDKIIPDALVAYVRAMEKDATISATYAPWWAYDDVEEKIIHGYFEVPKRAIFSIAEPLAMLDFMTTKLVFPESAIYRTDALHAIAMSRADGPYQSFLMAYALLGQGRVVFEKDPFYLEIAVAKPHFPVAMRMNVAITLTYLDNIRGSMEIMITRMLQQIGAPKLPDGLRLNVHEALLNYAHNRLFVAFRRALSLRQFILASELAQRLMLWHGIFQEDLPAISAGLYAQAGVQAAANIAASKTWLEQIYILGFEQTPRIIEIMRETLSDIPIAAADLATIHAHPHPERVMVLVKHAADRTALLPGALLPGNILALQQLADYYQILPAKNLLEGL